VQHSFLAIPEGNGLEHVFKLMQYLDLGVMRGRDLGSSAPLKHRVTEHAEPFAYALLPQPDRTSAKQKAQHNSFCAEGRNRTGDTWFFRSCSQGFAKSRRNQCATTHGSDQRQMVQQEGRRAGFSVLGVVTDESGR
jgi:hypothetical protein